MKAFSAGLTLVNVATMAGLLLGIVGGGLDEGFAGLALLLGLAAAVYAWVGTTPFSIRKVAAAAPPPQLPKSKRARRRMKLATPTAPPPPPRRWHFWGCAVGIVFAMFAVRSFCWLLWIDGNNLKIQSPNNLGDLALHITYMKYFANGVALWPDNPIHVFSSLRYPAGIDLFDSLLLLQHVDLIRALVWTGLIGSLATFYGFYRWGGAFGVAGFLFNGGARRLRVLAKVSLCRLPGGKDCLEEHPVDDVRHPARLALRDTSGATAFAALAAEIFPGRGRRNGRAHGVGSCRGGSSGRSTRRCLSCTFTPSSRSRSCSVFGCSSAAGRHENKLRSSSLLRSFRRPGSSG